MNAQYIESDSFASFDPSAIVQHVAMLHRVAERCGRAGKLILCAFNEGAAPVVLHFAPGDISAMTGAALGFASVPGANVYAPLALMRPDLEQGGKGAIADVIAVLGAVVDGDADKGKPAPQPPVPAPYVLESSADNSQHFLLLDRALPVDEAAPLLAALERATGADCAGDPSHVWRLAGTLNWPTRSKIKRGRSPEPQRVRVLRPWDGSAVSVDELRRVLEPHWQAPVRESEPPSVGGDLDPADVAALAKFLAEHDEFNEYADWVGFGMALKLALGDAGFEVWKIATWPDAIDAAAGKWSSFATDPRPGAQTLNTWFARAHALGWRGSVRKSMSSMFGSLPVVAANSLMGGGAAHVPTMAAPEYGESEIAERFVQECRSRIRYVVGRGWIVWNGKRWCVDETSHVADMVRQHCKRESALAAGTPNHARVARSLMSASTTRSILYLIQVDQRIAERAADWDNDEFLLGCPDGVVDLRSGTLREARPDDRVTKSTSVTPGGDGCPTWLRVIDQATGGDKETVAYLQKLFGYSLTASTREQILVFMQGPPAASKGTVLHAMEGIMGDYHKEVPIAALSESKFDKSSADIASLHGARLVTCAETKRGRRWDESLLNQLTGGDMVSCRFLYQNPFQSRAMYKIFVSGNHRPRLSADGGLRRRLRLIPFLNVVPEHERDSNLGNKLKKEWPGILGWAIAGCVAWQREGLCTPKVVTDASREYFEEEARDTLSMWLSDRCDSSDPTCETPHGLLYDSYKNFAERSGDKPMISAQLGRDLKQLGFKGDHRRNGNVVVGLKLRTPPAPTMRTQP